MIYNEQKMFSASDINVIRVNIIAWTKGYLLKSDLSRQTMNSNVRF